MKTSSTPSSKAKATKAAAKKTSAVAKARAPKTGAAKTTATKAAAKALKSAKTTAKFVATAAAKASAKNASSAQKSAEPPKQATPQPKQKSYDYVPAHIMHKTKILCTFGPAISSEEKVTELLKVGATAFRLNMSHGSHEMHKNSVQIIRSVEKQLGIHIPIIADLQGPKIRVGDLEGAGVSLINGTIVKFADEAVWKKLKQPKDVIPVRYPTFANDVKKGNTILFDDGLLKVQVRDTDGKVVSVIVENGGLLKSRKGINLPNVHVSQPSLTEKDQKDLLFAIEQGCDYLALSFVRTAQDVISTREIMKKHGGSMWIIAKIEKPEAITNIETIVDVSDAIMIARGDMGVEIPAAEVPIVQKRIITLCNNLAKPVITATQMLESMIQNPRPTRAEASDVSNAVFDGTDVVMLSAETSVGAFPVETVTYMRTICAEAEREMVRSAEMQAKRAEAALHIKLPDDRADAIAGAVGTITREMNVDAIAAVTTTGKITRYMASRKFTLPIFAITQDADVSRKVSLLWGVYALQVRNLKNTDEAIEVVKDVLVDRGYLPKGSVVAISIGRPLHLKSRTNMLSIEQL
jgi:pyruvate kinase